MTQASQDADTPLPSPPPNRVLAATLDGATLVAVQGTANFRLAPAFKQALKAAEASSATILVDMSACTHVDSTFMGAIAAAALAARKAAPGGPALHFLDIRPNVAQLLKGLGILPLMRVAPAGDAPALAGLAENLAPVDAGPVSDQSMAAILYDAHDTLARMSPENQARFRDVLSFLRGDLERAGGRPEATP